MSMCLPNRELLMTDAENASVFGSHFQRVFNNHISIDWPVIEKIKKIDLTKELDHPISWNNIKKSTTKLAKYKSPGLNGVPPYAFKALDEENLSWLLTSTDGTKSKYFPYPKRQHLRPQKLERGNPNGNRQQDLQQHHVWTIIQNN